MVLNPLLCVVGIAVRNLVRLTRLGKQQCRSRFLVIWEDRAEVRDSEVLPEQLGERLAKIDLHREVPALEKRRGSQAAPLGEDPPPLHASPEGEGHRGVTMLRPP